MGANRRFGRLAAVVLVIAAAIFALPASAASAEPVRVGSGVFLTEASELPGKPPSAAAVGSERTPRIVGGAPTTIQDWPWQVALTWNPTYYSGNTWDRLRCGGSLVTPTIFITAAHCFYLDGGFLSPSYFAAVSGRTRLSSTEGRESPLATYYVFVDDFSTPLYDPTSFRWDVVIAELSSPASGSPIQIAGPDERALWTEGRTAYVTGWGDVGNGSYPDDLYATQLAITSDADCSAAWPGVFYSDVMVCAFATGRDTCFGDSGGPLVVPTADDRMRLVGDTSGGSDPCGQAPGIYGRLADDPIRSALQNAVQDIAGVNVVGSGARPQPAYTTFVSCKRKPLRQSHFCPPDSRRINKVFIAFRSNRVDTNWKPCVRLPSRRLSCAPVQSARQGVLYTIGYTGVRAGTYKFTWRVRGRQIGAPWSAFLKL